MITIKVTGLEDAIRRYGMNIKPALQAGCMGIGEAVRGRIAKYPGGVAHPIRWASAKQRRYYFWMRGGKKRRFLFWTRQGKQLAAKYTRQSDPMSQRLGPSWTVAKEGDIGAVVRNRATYAKWVQSEARQQPMHKATGWKTDREAVDETMASGDISRIMEAAIRKALGGR